MIPAEPSCARWVSSLAGCFDWSVLPEVEVSWSSSSSFVHAEESITIVIVITTIIIITIIFSPGGKKNNHRVHHHHHLFLRGKIIICIMIIVITKTLRLLLWSKWIDWQFIFHKKNTFCKWSTCPLWIFVNTFLLLKCLLLLFLIFSDKALSAEWYTRETNSKFRFRLARCNLAKCVRSSKSSKNESEVVRSQTRLLALKIGKKI